MAFFKKQGGDTSAVSAEEAPEAQNKKPEKKKKIRDNERLKSVLKESTFGAAIETLEANLRFRLQPDEAGNPRWLALLLKTEAIGGLSEKTKRDEAKGSLVQLITSDQIQAIATEEMLEREFFTLVPSEETLHRMSEFSLLTNAQYYWVVFSSQDGTLTFDQNIGPAKYEDAVAIQSGTPMETVIAQSGEEGPDTWARLTAGAGSQATDEAASAPLTIAETTGATPVVDEVFGAPAESGQAPADTSVSETDVEQVEPPEPEVISEEDAGDFYENLEAEESFFDEGYDELAELSEGDVVEDIYDDSAGVEVEEEGLVDQDVVEDDSIEEEEEVKSEYTEYLELNRDRSFSEADMRATIARRFLTEDLDLFVDMEDFNQVFGDSVAPAVNVSDVAPDDATDWLGKQIAQMAHAANSELKVLHDRQFEQLKQMYVDYSSRHIQEVIKNVSIDDPSSKFGKMISLAQGDREQEKGSAHTRVTQLRQDIEARFNSEEDRAAEAAAAQARQTFNQMNRNRREAELAQVEREVTEGIEARFEHERQQILRLRRSDADLGIQKGKTVIFEALAEERERHATEQEELLKKWNAQILKVVDENRKSDVARAEALAENLARTNAVEEERKRSAKQLAELQEAQLERVKELKQQTADVHREAIEAIKKRDEEWQSRVNNQKAETQKSNKLVQELQDQLKNLTGTVQEHYEGRLSAMRQSRDLVAEELERANKAATRVNHTLVLLMVVLSVAALGIGIICGWLFSQNSQSTTQSLGSPDSSISVQVDDIENDTIYKE